MTNQHFPILDPEKLADTRDALHSYAQILGSWTSTCRGRRKHWWHASLRPSLNGVTTGVIYAGQLNFEIELNISESELIVSTANGSPLRVELHGQPAAVLSEQIREHLAKAGVTLEFLNKNRSAKMNTGDVAYAAYSADQSGRMYGALSAVSAAMVAFRAGVREETSPIQLWPHHFDLSMLWLPGETIDGQDKDDEENSDKQMNFGFTFGDAGIPEPYFYITAYPVPDAFSSIVFPKGTEWRSDAFNGAVLLYRQLLAEADPSAYLLKLWNSTLGHGKQHLVNHTDLE